LGLALQLRFEITGSMEDLDCAIKINEQAVISTPADHPNCAMYLDSLGNALQRRFERTGSMEDINRAIDTKKRAMESTPADHSNRAVYLNNLGFAFVRNRYKEPQRLLVLILFFLWLKTKNWRQMFRSIVIGTQTSLEC